MTYDILFKEENENVSERYELAMDRISLILSENTTDEPFRDYFCKTADFILLINGIYKDMLNNKYENYTFDELKNINEKMYADILGDNYKKSYSNPEYAAKILGEKYGCILCFLYTEIRGMIAYAYENRLTEITIYSELFIEIYNYFENNNSPEYDELYDTVYWFNSDYSDIVIEHRTRELYDSSLSFASNIIMDSDLTDLRYLFKYGEYISENEIKTASYLNSLPFEKIKLMADSMSEGYRIGFILGNKDLSKKKYTNVEYSIGFERMIKEVITNFKELGLESVLFRGAVSSLTQNGGGRRRGFVSTSPNKQFDYDHKDDYALYFDKSFIERKLGVLHTAYEKYKENERLYAGPAVLETFGEMPFSPVTKQEAVTLDKKQQVLKVEYNTKARQLQNSYIKSEERSFTIIAFPVSEIGDDFEEIFEEIIKINTLDYKMYQDIQQTLIDALDTAEYVEIKGCNDNKTNLKVYLHAITDPNAQSKFENCLADVNIPVGEVFTSPVLKNTTGKLHVTSVYLNELLYKNLEIDFKDGMIVNYNCDNFSTESENKDYIKANILYHHDTLPIGEFAIGTNTTAYMLAKKYDISAKLPILIAEKMGPHFAVGDTCYSFSEDIKVYNPDKKEIIARDNEITKEFRETDASKAYFNCHTDITIPYDELLSINAVQKDGTHIKLIENGRFVLKGTEKLNIPFME